MAGTARQQKRQQSGTQRSHVVMNGLARYCDRVWMAFIMTAAMTERSTGTQELRARYTAGH